MTIRVLLVEDDYFLRQALAEYLEREHDCLVRQVEDRAGALRWIEQEGQEIEVALIDQVLGDDNGIDIMRLVKADYPLLPVIIFTGYGDIEAGRHAIRSGAYRYMEKPLKPEEVGLQVQLAAEHYRVLRERDILGHLLEVSRVLLRHTDLDSVLNAIAEGVRDLTGFQEVIVSVVRDGEVYHRGIVGIPEEQAQKIRQRVRKWEKTFGPLLRNAEVKGCKVGEYTYFIPEGTVDLSAYGLQGYKGEVCSKQSLDADEAWHSGDMFETVIRDEHGQIVGTIGVESPKDCRRPNKEIVQIMDLLAAQAAIAISRVRQLEDLLDTTAQVHTATSLKEALDLIAKQAARLLNADAGGVLLLNRARTHLYFAGAYGLSENLVKNTYEPVGRSISGRVVWDGEPRISHDVPNDPRFENPAAEGEGLLSIISVPISHEAEIIGTLDAQSKSRTHAFREEDISFLEQLARHAAVAIDRARFIEALKRTTQMARLVTQSASKETKPFLNAIVKGIGEIMEADCVILYPFDARAERFDVERIATWGLRRPDKFRPRDAVRQKENAVLHVLHHLHPPVIIENIDDPENPESKRFRNRKFIKREGIKALIAAPLTIPGHESAPLGVLFVNYRNPLRFTEWEKDIFQLIVSFGAVGFHTARAQERKQRELQALTDVVSIISDAGDVESVWEQVLAIAADVTQAEYGAFLMKDERSGTLRTLFAHGEGVTVEQLRQKDPMLARSGIPRWVADKRRSALACNISENEEWRDIYVEAIEGVKSELTVPILYGDDLLGIIDLESPRPFAFSREDQQFLESLANVAAISIHMARTHHRLERAHAILNALYRATQGAEDIPVILEQATKAVNADFGSIMLYDPFLHALKFAYYWPPGDYPALFTLGHWIPLERSDHKQGIEGRVFLSGKPALVPNVFEDEDYVDYTGETKAELAVPITDAQGQRVGVLNVESKEYDAFSPEDIDTLSVFAHQIGQLLSSQASKDKAEAHLMAAKLGMINATWMHEVRREVGRLHLELFTLKKRYEDVLDLRVRAELERIEGMIGDVMAEVPSPDTATDTTEAVRIGAFLNRAIPSIMKKYPDVFWTLDLQVAPETTVRTNTYWLRWTLRQIIENAAEAMAGQENKRLTARARGTGRSVIIEIEDNGPGIPPDVQSRLFKEPIPRTERSGVALLLARTIMRGLGGDLAVLDTGPEGTTMAILLPLSDRRGKS